MTGDQRGDRVAAEGPAEPADLPQGQSGRLPDPDLCGPFRRDPGVPARRLRQHWCWRERLSTVPGVGQVSIFGQKPYAARVQVNPAALAAQRHRPRRRPQRAGERDGQQPKGSIEGDAPDRSRSTPTTSCSTPRPSAMSSSPIATARRCASRMSATSIELGAERSASAPGSTTSRPRASRSRRRPAPTPSPWSTRSRR